MTWRWGDDVGVTWETVREEQREAFALVRLYWFFCMVESGGPDGSDLDGLIYDEAREAAAWFGPILDRRAVQAGGQPAPQPRWLPGLAHCEEEDGVTQKPEFEAMPFWTPCFVTGRQTRRLVLIECPDCDWFTMSERGDDQRSSPGYDRWEDHYLAKHFDWTARL